MTAKTFTQEIQSAHSRGDEDEINRLLDMQNAIKAEVSERIKSANDSAANLSHQLKALANLIDGAEENGVSIADGSAPLMPLMEVANAIQDWLDR